MLDRALGLVWTTCALTHGPDRPGMNQTGSGPSRPLRSTGTSWSWGRPEQPAQRSDLQGQASWNASNVSCLKSSCIRSGCASTYWTTTRANCDALKASGGQNCSPGGSTGQTATSPCTTPEQKCAPEPEPMTWWRWLRSTG